MTGMTGMTTWDLYDVVLREYLKADKSPRQALQASAAWIAAGRSVTL